MRKGRCKFWNGAHNNTCCDAGVRYNSVVTQPTNPNGIAYRYPCVRVWPIELTAQQMEHFSNKGHCDKYTEPTDEDIKSFEAEGEKLCRDIAKCAPLLQQNHKEHKGKNWAGKVDCPICNGKGTLQVRHAPNTHIWVKCETAGCIAWVQ
jgi:hypothetical protein